MMYDREKVSMIYPLTQPYTSLNSSRSEKSIFAIIHKRRRKLQLLNQEIMGFCAENPGACGKTVDLIENSVRIKSIPFFFFKEVTCNSSPRAIILQQHCHIAFLNFSSK